ncbi:MAG: hypothetical protein ACFB10_22615 [Salibacteraceae bacterium]
MAHPIFRYLRHPAAHTRWRTLLRNFIGAPLLFIGAPPDENLKWRTLGFEECATCVGIKTESNV